ncbi:MAG: HAMP domain-containing sensor histidine kinase [Polyangiaceae bacterium]
MPSGGDLRVEGRVEGEQAAIVVRDTGAGMTEDVRRRATEPLFSTKEPGFGTGLGLSVSMGIVASAGGTMSIDSAPGCGTAVTVRLPGAPETARRAPLEMACA